MFDLISGGPRHPFHKPTILPTLVSVAGHGLVLLAVAGASFVVATDQLPALPGMMAFVTAAPAPSPPPPPPPVRRAAPAKTDMLATTRAAAPVEAPTAIPSEMAIAAEEDEEGVEGGVEGGIAGGTLGGVIGGLLAAPLAPPPSPPPPPAPAAPPPRTPVRIGGQLTAPALLYKVNPVYPEVAVHAKVAGTVILEATVDTEGKVESVRVLRSNNLLNNAAIDAVKQWRYSPLVLNGIPTPFVLTVILSFSLQQK